MSSKIRINVSVDDAHADRLSDVQHALEREGMTVHSVLDVLGVISGEVDEAAVSQLRSVEGISHVEPDRPMQLPPPEGDVQ